MHWPQNLEITLPLSFAGRNNPFPNCGSELSSLDRNTMSGNKKSWNALGQPESDKGPDNVKDLDDKGEMKFNQLTSVLSEFNFFFLNRSNQPRKTENKGWRYRRQSRCADASTCAASPTRL